MARYADFNSGSKKMRRFSIFLIVLAVCLQIATAKSVLKEFFGDREYETSIYTLSDKDLYFSCSWVDKESQIWDRGMLYQKHDGHIEPLLIVDEEMRVYNSQELLADFEWPTPTFYGWKARINADKQRRYVNFLIEPFADMGKSTTDGISFFWDYENQVYKKEVIDRSQW